MAGPDRTTLILLAAGRSLRFGAADKLLASRGGRALISHAVAALAPLRFAERIAVVSGLGGAVADILTDAGFRLVHNDAPEAGLSRSIALGVAASGDPEAVLIALADMPDVPAGHFAALCTAVSPTEPVVATAGPDGPMAPAAFAAAALPKLTGLSGDAGARALIRTAPTVAIDPALLIDIDRPEQLRRSPAADPDTCRE